MVGLLSEIQRYFDASYSGQYIAYLLAELFRQSPGDFSKVLKALGFKYTHKKGDGVVANHWAFPGKNQRRYADIAVLSSDGTPLVLIEIKDADINSTGNLDQLTDYLEFIGRRENNKAEFLFLSRTTPADIERKKLEQAAKKGRVRRALFGQLYKPLTEQNPFCSMLRQYLEDIDVAYFDKRPDRKTVDYVARRMLGFGGRQVTEKSIPEFFEVAFSDLSAMGQWVQSRNPGLFKQGFRRRIFVEPWHDLQKVAATINGKDKNKARALVRSGVLKDFCNGGEVCIYTCGYLTHKGTKVYLEFGYWIEIEKAKGQFRSSRGIYANIQWKPWKVSAQDSIDASETLKEFPNEDDFQKALRGFLKDAKKSILTRKTCPTEVRKVVANFNVP